MMSLEELELKSLSIERGREAGRERQRERDQREAGTVRRIPRFSARLGGVGPKRQGSRRYCKLTQTPARKKLGESSYLHTLDRQIDD